MPPRFNASQSGQPPREELPGRRVRTHSPSETPAFRCPRWARSKREAGENPARSRHIALEPRCIHWTLACWSQTGLKELGNPSVEPVSPRESAMSFWSRLRTLAAQVSPPELARWLVERQSAMPEDLRAHLVLPLAWAAFRFAPERSAFARVQVPLMVVLMQRGEFTVEKFVEYLEHFGGDEAELARLVAAPASTLELEIVEGLEHRRGGREAVVDMAVQAVGAKLGLADDVMPDRGRALGGNRRGDGGWGGNQGARASLRRRSLGVSRLACARVGAVGSPNRRFAPGDRGLSSFAGAHCRP